LFCFLRSRFCQCPLSNIIPQAPATTPPAATTPATTPAFTPQAPAFTPQSTPAPAASTAAPAEPAPAQSTPAAPVVVASSAPAASNNNNNNNNAVNNNETGNNNANASSAQAAPANNNQAATPAQTGTLNSVEAFIHSEYDSSTMSHFHLEPKKAHAIILFAVFFQQPTTMSTTSKPRRLLRLQSRLKLPLCSRKRPS
jgi:hypothetical protein